MGTVATEKPGVCEAASILVLVPGGADRRREGRALAASLVGDELGLVLRGVHPDLIELLPPEGKERIGIDQVREVIRLGQFAPAQGRRKVCLVPHAESLTPEAANALLKVLEEPPRDLAFLLLVEEAADVLPTILSRSRVVRLPPRSSHDALLRLVRAGYREEEGRYLVAAARGEEEMAGFLEARQDIAALREEAKSEARLADAGRLAEMATSLRPIERHEAILSLLARLVAGEAGLRVAAARALSQQGREGILGFLEDLFFRSFDLVRGELSPSPSASDDGVALLVRKVDPDRTLGFVAAIERARRAVEVYTPGEAVLLSVFVLAGRLRRG